MSLNRTAKGIVLVPSVLLGGAFLAAAAWGDSAAASNKGLALVLGGVLVGGGLLAQLLPEQNDSPNQRDGDKLNVDKLKDDTLSAERQRESGEGA
jgi:predicted phage tail protein